MNGDVAFHKDTKVTKIILSLLVIMGVFDVELED